MYASDLTHRKRAATIYRNLQLQKDWFNSGRTIRILGQKGGNDYSYMTDLEKGCIQDTCWKIEIPINPTPGDDPMSTSINRMAQVDFTGIYDSGNPPTGSGALDDAFIPLPMEGMDFYFFGTNCGALGTIKWYSDNALVFDPAFSESVVDINHDTSPAILMGNYDRLCSAIYYSNSLSYQNKFRIAKFIIYFANSYNDILNLSAGKIMIRLIRELAGTNRQWVEVTVISSVSKPGYSNNVAAGETFDSSGNPLDSNSNPIDPTKNSPWDITNGSKFLNIAGSQYSTAFPATGTTLLYQSDSLGVVWSFSNHAFMDV